MNVSLTPELETLISDKVKSGRYNTASEVVREGLRLLEHQDQLRELRRDELRKEIMKGVEQMRNGQYTDYVTAQVKPRPVAIPPNTLALAEQVKEADSPILRAFLYVRIVREWRQPPRAQGPGPETGFAQPGASLHEPNRLRANGPPSSLRSRSA